MEVAVRVLKQRYSCTMERGLSTCRAGVVVYVVDSSRGEQATLQFGWANCSLQLEVATDVVPQLRRYTQHPIVGDGQTKAVQFINEVSSAGLRVNHHTQVHRHSRLPVVTVLGKLYGTGALATACTTVELHELGHCKCRSWYR